MRVGRPLAYQTKATWNRQRGRPVTCPGGAICPESSLDSAPGYRYLGLPTLPLPEVRNGRKRKVSPPYLILPLDAAAAVEGVEAGQTTHPRHQPRREQQVQVRSGVPKGT